MFGDDFLIPDTVFVKRASEDVKLPSRGTWQAAAHDVHAYLPTTPLFVAPLQTVKVPTGLFFAIPENSAMLICSRSGLASKGLMVANGPGILDSDYRGELLVLLTYVAPADAKPFTIQNGDRIAQLLFTPRSALSYPHFAAVAELPATNSNRTGGFGSTGIK